MIELLFGNDKAPGRTRRAATPKLPNASIRRCTSRSPDRLSRRAEMATISRAAMTSATYLLNITLVGLVAWWFCRSAGSG
jgi:hypothetical protein